MQTVDIFVDVTVPDIVRQALELVGLDEPGADCELGLLRSYPERELVVQDQETDANFVSRLAEHLGIFMLEGHP